MAEGHLYKGEAMSAALLEGERFDARVLWHRVKLSLSRPLKDFLVAGLLLCPHTELSQLKFSHFGDV